MSLLRTVVVPVLNSSCLEYLLSPRRPDLLSIPYPLDDVTATRVLVTVEEFELEAEVILRAGLCLVPRHRLPAVGLHLARLNAASHHVKWSLTEDSLVTAMASPGCSRSCRRSTAGFCAWPMAKQESGQPNPSCVIWSWSRTSLPMETAAHEHPRGL